MSKIEIKNINKSFGSITALKNISFTSKENEFITILGSSGCGKTTLLRIIAGLEKENSGKVLIDGQDVTYKAPKDRNISMVFQTSTLYPQKTVYENIAFPLKLQKMDKKEIQEKVEQLAKKMEIYDLLDRKPNTLSGGQKQRVCIAKALIKTPKIYLFDEPLSSLDANLKNKMREELKELHKNTGAVFIYVTHDQSEALYLGDRIIVMNNGKIEQIGTVDEIYNKPKNLFVANFIGTPKINLISNEDYFIITNNDELPNDVIIAVRPEDILIKNSENSNATITYKENCGKNIIYKVIISNREISVETNKDNNEYNIGEKVLIKIKKSHIFNKKTHERIEVSN